MEDNREIRWGDISLAVAREKSDKSVICIQVHNDEMLLAYRDNRQPSSYCHSVARVPFDSRSQWSSIIKEFQEKQQIDNQTDVIGLLSTGDYQLITIDKPDVSESEIRSAIPWAVSTQISRPLDQVIFEYFSLPYASTQTSKSQLMVVAANKDTVSDFKRAIESSRMNLVSMTIPEMTCMWLMKHCYPDVDSYVLIRWLTNAAEMIIVNKGELVLTAILPKPPVQIDAEFINTFSLSISQLFFRFQKVMPEIETCTLPIWFGFIEGHNDELIDFFHENFTNEIHLLDLKTTDLLSQEIESTNLIKTHLALYGGLVRDE